MICFCVNEPETSPLLAGLMYHNFTVYEDYIIFLLYVLMCFVSNLLLILNVNHCLFVFPYKTKCIESLIYQQQYLRPLHLPVTYRLMTVTAQSKASFFSVLYKKT